MKEMKLFRHKKDGQLYKVYRNTPMRYAGTWYSAEPYFPNCGKVLKDVNLEDFVVVAETGVSEGEWLGRERDFERRAKFDALMKRLTKEEKGLLREFFPSCPEGR